MKTIGLLGGMSWESTALYYREINEYVKRALGGLHSAKCIVYSVDFHEIEECQSTGDWAKAAAILSAAAKSLEAIGAELIVICTNTMHKVADEIQSGLTIPVLHIADVTADELVGRSIKKAALLGTKYTMEQEFYKSRLTARGIDVVVPDKNGRDFVNNVIFNEACLGIISPESKQRLAEIIAGLDGAEGVILGCTELGLLITSSDTDLPFLDTALIHARRAAGAALG
jgi:aspartate racemase